MSTPSTFTMAIRTVDDLLEKIKNMVFPVRRSRGRSRVHDARWMLPGFLVGASERRALRG
jgi:hypothetical protein